MNNLLNGLKFLLLSFVLSTSSFAFDFDEQTAPSQSYRAVYSTMISIIVPIEFLSTQLPLNITEFISNIGDRDLERDFHELRDDAVDYIATGRMSKNLEYLIDEVRASEHGKDLNSEQIAGMVIGSVQI